MKPIKHMPFKILFLVVTFLFISACSLGAVNRFTYEGVNIQFEIRGDINKQTAERVVSAYLEKVGVSRAMKPIVVEALTSVWQDECLSINYFSGVNRDFCSADYLVFQDKIFFHGSINYGIRQRHFVFKQCSDLTCEYKVGENVHGADIDPTVAVKILDKYAKEVGVFDGAAPIFLEQLSDEWRVRCHTSERLSRVLGDNCDAVFVVTQNYRVRVLFETHEDNQRRYVLYDCNDDGCEYRISTANYAID